MGSAKKEVKPSPRSIRKAAKRKAEDAIPDVPQDYANFSEANRSDVRPLNKRKRNDEEAGEETKKSKKVKNEKVEAKEKKEKERKQARKEKKEKAKSEKEEKKPTTEDVVEKEDLAIPETGTVAEPSQEIPKKSKKERKAERKALEAAEAAANAKLNEALEAAEPTAPTSTTDELKKSKATPTATEGKASKAPKLDADGNPIKKKNNRNREKKRLAAAAAAASGEKAAPRFIVFVGNLPFTATTESITAHFAAVHPVSVRNLTQKDDPAKSKGCAFVEFEGYDHMKTCLKAYHHSEFDDGKSAKRKINVELTAGGGGNTKVRKGKIAEKNVKLMEQRTRRIGEEEKQKLVKRGIPEEDQSGIHPSRRARVA